MTIYKIAVYLGYFISLIASILYLAKFKKLEKPLKVFSVFLVLLTTVNITGGILSHFKIHNVFLWHLFNYVEWLFMARFFSLFYNGKYLHRFKIVAIMVLITLLYGSLFVNQLSDFNTIGYFVLKMFIIVLCIIEIYKSQLVSKKHHYYLNIGTVIISIVSVSFFTFWNLRNSGLFDMNVRVVLYITNAVGFVFGLLFYLVEIFKLGVWKENR